MAIAETFVSPSTTEDVKIGDGFLGKLRSLFTKGRG